jgi:hypothetical protein
MDPKKAAYRADLEAQIRQREELKAQEKQKERSENARLANATMPWVPQRRGRALVPGRGDMAVGAHPAGCYPVASKEAAVGFVPWCSCTTRPLQVLRPIIHLVQDC